MVLAVKEHSPSRFGLCRPYTIGPFLNRFPDIIESLLCMVHCHVNMALEDGKVQKIEHLKCSIVRTWHDILADLLAVEVNVYVRRP